MQQATKTSALAIKTIFTAGLIAGLLDGAAAVMILAKYNFEAVFRYVASGAFGQKAFSAGQEMIVYGMVFHLLIALGWAAIYYLLYKLIPAAQKNFIVSGLLYGMVVWLIMNRLVVPLSHVQQRPFNLQNALKNMAILMVAIGLTVAFITHRFCNRHKTPA